MCWHSWAARLSPSLMLLYLMTFLIPRIPAFSAGEPSICLSWPPAASDASGVQGGRGRGHWLLQPPPTCPGPTYPRQQQPHRRAAPSHGTRPAARHAAATRPELTCVGCSGSESAAARPISGTCGTQHRSAHASSRMPTGETE